MQSKVISVLKGFQYLNRENRMKKKRANPYKEADEAFQAEKA